MTLLLEMVGGFVVDVFLGALSRESDDEIDERLVRRAGIFAVGLMVIGAIGVVLLATGVF